MGREVRRVPADWEHPTWINPRSKQLQPKPLYKGDSADDMAEWQNDHDRYLSDQREWESGSFVSDWTSHIGEGRYQWSPPEHSSKPGVIEGFREYAGSLPSPPYKWDYMGAYINGRECTAYQVYETVSEGTPVSPVFQTRDAMVAWLIEQGHDRQVAEKFAACGWAPSMVISGGRIATGIDAHSS